MTPEEVRAITDPAERARAAGDAILELARIENELSHIRADAVNELRAAGLSHADVANELGVSRSRAAAIATGPTGPSGGGHITVRSSVTGAGSKVLRDAQTGKVLSDAPTSKVQKG